MIYSNFNTPLLSKVINVVDFMNLGKNCVINYLSEVLDKAPKEYIDALSKNKSFLNFLDNFFEEVYMKHRNFQIGFYEEVDFLICLQILIKHIAMNLVMSWSLMDSLEFENMIDLFMNGTRTWSEHKDNEGNYQSIEWIDDIKKDESDAFSTSGSKDQSSTKYGSEMYVFKQNFDNKPIMTYQKLIEQFDELFVINYNIERMH